MYRPTQLAHYRPTYRPIRPLSTNLSKVVFCRVGTEPYPGCLPRVLPYKNFCEICRTFIPVPGTSVSSARHSYPYPELLSALYAGATNTRGTGTAFLYLPGTCVSSVRPCHNTRNLCEFSNTSIPVPETSGSSVRLPYPYPESTNPTEHNLESID